AAADSDLELGLVQAVARVSGLDIGSARSDAGQDQPQPQRDQEDRPDVVPVDVLEDARVREQEEDADDDKEAAPEQARAAIRHRLSAPAAAKDQPGPKDDQDERPEDVRVQPVQKAEVAKQEVGADDDQHAWPEEL